MTAKHTKGPWGIINGDAGPIIFSGDKGAMVAYVSYHLDDNSQANARLISAAPDLLQAAKDVLSHKRGEGDWLILSVHCQALEEAITKATGETE